VQLYANRIGAKPGGARISPGIFSHVVQGLALQFLCDIMQLWVFDSSKISILLIN